ncbi:MAG: hypothetical protein KJ721_00625, partial [Nanoarchaeota archaeon]|nr:hypothetical protein [Nanoarchaeota archaeon]
MKKEKKIQKIILLIKGEDKERDLNAVEFLQMIHLLKLHYIWDDYKKIKRIKNPKYEVKKIEEEFLLGTSKAGENWMRKQVYGETILFQGISFFQKVCKDWFQIGLIYSPKRLNHFKEKEIKIGAILEKENLRLGISELIIEKINFNDI